MQAQASSLLTSFIRPLYRFIYPPICLVCESHLTDDEHKICTRCWESIKSILPDDDLYVEMKTRLTSSGYIAGLVSAFHFEKEGTLQSLIHQLKYEEMTSVGVELGKRVGLAFSTSFHGVPKATIIPVPLHPVKKRERGYNQSDFIAKGISQVTGLQVVSSILTRRKNTKTQTKLNLAERKENMSDAFELNTRYSSRISKSSFVLVDDVITTGATIQECGQVLIDGGAANVYVASVALADHSHVPQN